MEYKKFTIGILLVTLVLLIIVAGSAYTFDPFFQYHMPWFGLKPIVDDERYQNAGLARNFQYDSLITGSSMSENFKASWFDSAFDTNTVKLTFSGGLIPDYVDLFSNVFESHLPKYVFYSLDPIIYKEEQGHRTFDLPLYLYDRSSLNDVSYLLNKDVLFKTYSLLLRNWNNDVPDMDNAFRWYKNFTFSKETVLGIYKRSSVREAKPSDYYLPNAAANLSRISPFIRDNPGTTFYIFFPPYSIVNWDARIRSGLLDADMSMLDYLISSLLEYDNVKLFYFQNIEDIITNLDNYKDWSHYSPDVNKFMVDCMAEDKYRLTVENYKAELQKMREIATNYDYEALFANSP